MSGEGVATERRKAEFKVEVKSEDDLIVLLRATFKSHMNACELAYRRGNKQGLMAALQIHFGLRQPAGLPPPESWCENLTLPVAPIPSHGTMYLGSLCGARERKSIPRFW